MGWMVQVLQNGHPRVAGLEAFPCQVSMSKLFSFEKFAPDSSSLG